MRFTVDTGTGTAVHDVTEQVTDELPSSGDGVATVFVRHTTAGLVVNEPESRLLADVEDFLSELVPDEGWEHDQIDDNADSHLRALLLGESVTVPVLDGEPDLGTWQAILLVECDGPRSRTVEVIVH